jgi:hypothetical protein
VFNVSYSVNAITFGPGRAIDHVRLVGTCAMPAALPSEFQNPRDLKDEGNAAQSNGTIRNGIEEQSFYMRYLLGASSEEFPYVVSEGNADRENH